MKDKFYMDLAIKKAWEYQILTYPNPAVGCVILNENDKILSISAHKKAGFLHAEPLAILQALFNIDKFLFLKFKSEYLLKFGVNLEFDELEIYDLEPNFSYEFIMQNHNNKLKNAKAYVTLEPCSHHGKTPPCANLFVALGFNEVIISCIDENKIASGGSEILKNAGIKVKIGICQRDGERLLEPFLAWQKANFGFFKLALSLNGVITGGIISNEKSRTHSHKLRSVIDLLVIGGNTVNIDRPTLDTRLIKNGKNPNVLIYSRKENFDKTIPLFSIPNRSVNISNNLNFDSKLTMYEGGEGLLKEAVNKRLKNLNWFLIYKSSELKEGKNLRLNVKFRPIFEGHFDDDTYGWYELC